MMKHGQFIDIVLNFDQSVEDHLKKEFPWVFDFRIVSKALDARGANKGKVPRYNYRLHCLKKGESFEDSQGLFPNLGPLEQKPIIIGAGPAGLFCALRLLEYGVPSVILERGSRASERMKKIAAFWRRGVLDPDDNVCYGEGGAGLFSDGKLITRIKSPHVSYVMRRLVDFGAPPETAYLSDPHLGSNRIRTLIGKLTSHLEQNGVETFFNARASELIFENGTVKGVSYFDVKSQSTKKIFSNRVILAFGHSATEFYRYLHEQKIPMAQKDFAVGVRMEHPRRLIDRSQLGDFCLTPDLGSARYRLSYHSEATDRGTYSFCMCPGGHVLSSGTEKDGLVTNGMSNYSRSSPWSNSALVVSIKTAEDIKKPEDVLSGLQFQRDIEKRAYDFSKKNATGREIPSQTIVDFLKNKVSTSLPKSSCPSGLVSAPMKEIFSPLIINHLGEALEKFERQIPGLLGKDGLLLAPETRTSSPLRLLRHETELSSPGLEGLYPCGEGAGFAGGITSAAVDGIKVAMAILLKDKKHEDTLP